MYFFWISFFYYFVCVYSPCANIFIDLHDYVNRSLSLYTYIYIYIFIRYFFSAWKISSIVSMLRIWFRRYLYTTQTVASKSFENFSYICDKCDNRTFRLVNFDSLVSIKRFSNNFQFYFRYCCSICFLKIDNRIENPISVGFRWKRVGQYSSSWYVPSRLFFIFTKN